MFFFTEIFQKKRNLQSFLWNTDETIVYVFLKFCLYQTIFSLLYFTKLMGLIGF